MSNDFRRKVVAGVRDGVKDALHYRQMGSVRGEVSGIGTDVVH